MNLVERAQQRPRFLLKVVCLFLEFFSYFRLLIEVFVQFLDVNVHNSRARVGAAPTICACVRRSASRSQTSRRLNWVYPTLSDSDQPRTANCRTTPVNVCT